MSDFCSLCGNMNRNRTFKGGVICADCLSLIQGLNIRTDNLNLRDFPAPGSDMRSMMNIDAGSRQPQSAAW